jgi:hypothetical protein
MNKSEKIAMFLFVLGFYGVIVGLFVKNGFFYLFGTGLICIGCMFLFWEYNNDRST